MSNPVYWELEALANTPQERTQTIFYVAEQLSRFLKKREYVLICFPKKDFEALGTIFEQAVLQLDAIPIFWGPDHKWKTLLRQAFATRATAIIGPPLVILGLSKLAKATGTPLNIRNVVTAGYPCVDWMIDGIIRGLDCGTWGCFGPGTGAMVSGFSCGQSRGVHIRENRYHFEIVGPEGNPLPDGTVGEIVVSSRDHSTLRLPIKDQGRLDRSPCPCGCRAPRLMDIAPGAHPPSDMIRLSENLHSWTSILDCKLKRGPYGLEMELVVFPGEKLPKLPTCAKRVIRPWNPEEDAPFSLIPTWESCENTGETH